MATNQGHILAAQERLNNNNNQAVAAKKSNTKPSKATGQNNSGPTVRVATAASGSCPLQSITRSASSWLKMAPPSNDFGSSSLDFIKGIYNKSCQPILQPIAPNKIESALPNGLNPGSVIVFGKGDKRIAGLVNKCDQEGTCEAFVRFPNQVYAIKFNTKYPHVYQNNQRKVINTLIKLPGSKQVASSGELILEAHQAYGRYDGSNVAVLDENN